jgi:hypothetical protein
MKKNENYLNELEMYIKYLTFYIKLQHFFINRGQILSKYISK